MWTLVVESGKHRGRQVKLTAEVIVVGRSEDAQIRVGSGNVSREHCTLRPTNEGVLVKDHGSRNGTLINDVRIETELLLAPGNTLTVGPMRFRLAKVPEGSKRLSRKSYVDPKLSDDDIADWLTDDDMPALGDTTIIGFGTAAPPPESDADASKDVDAEPKRWVPPPSKMRFDSIAEEAADIIRRHHNMLKAEEGTS